MFVYVMKRTMLLNLIFFSILDASYQSNIGLRCDMIPEGVTAPKSIQDVDRYKIEVSGSPDAYVPGEQYTVFLRAVNNGLENQHKFTHFILSVTNENPEKNIASETSIGSMQLYGDALTKFSQRCRNAVVEADNQPKAEVQFLWVAPVKGSGCVKFKATVVESVDKWFNEDSDLTKVLCEEAPDTEDTQPKILKQCCTCDEAKYEVTFEGLWSRNTHPKDFPANGRVTRFSDIIGASHTVNYSFWNYGDLSSEGLQQLAEYGNTRLLESELKAKSDQIRTIIKARGISSPNITGKTFAVFRVDSKHHLMSIVSMIDPSPDWIVGVSGLELCLRNCTWIESKVLNLYPWDVGTDDGITYLSVNQPAPVRQPIRRLKYDFPDDPRSPFYDPSATPLKPFARLRLTRQRLYEKSCDILPDEDTDDKNTNCETTDWSEWSLCSATCGRGIKYKQRRYKNDESKYMCRKKLTERATCESSQKYCPQVRKNLEDDPLCELSPWSSWSSCSATCGKGTKTRDRKFKNRYAAKRCVHTSSKPLILQQNLECWAEEKCEEFFDEIPDELADCPERPWSNWSPCSATCDKGIKERYRLSLKYTGHEAIFGPKRSKENRHIEEPCERKIKEIVECYERPCEREQKLPSAAACGLPRDVGACKSNVDRWYYDVLKGRCEIFSYSGCEGNQNNFNTLELCQTVCTKYQKALSQRKKIDGSISGILSYNVQNDATTGNKCAFIENQYENRKTFTGNGTIVDCLMSNWSGWSQCLPSIGDCGPGYKVKYRHVKVSPRNGGLPCQKKMMKKKKCLVHCNK
ncbi:spondin-1 isoform X2 [Anthonomus grandis grandis]|uniref:spondin-1 isoform X2 n=1 Tax=Anthonomus grandis grandis TaxID=2921223 RepID=UPI0021654746|nr:spondin-1 isoform X2 [Anthonomus grandis grandis]